MHAHLLNAQWLFLNACSPPFFAVKLLKLAFFLLLNYYKCYPYIFFMPLCPVTIQTAIF